MGNTVASPLHNSLADSYNDYVANDDQTCPSSTDHKQPPQGPNRMGKKDLNAQQPGKGEGGHSASGPVAESAVTAEYDKHFMSAQAAQESDKQLVRKVQQGDKRAFDLLVLKYQHKILSIVSRFIKDSGEIHDVAQETFIKAYRAIGNFRGDSAFYTWIYRIAINTAKNYLVSRGRRPPASDVEVQDAEFYSGGEYLKELGTPEHQMMCDELERTVNQAIRDLPDDLRTAVTLREMEGLSYEEIAEVMACPVGTVRSRIFRAREYIDKQIAPLVG